MEPDVRIEPDEFPVFEDVSLAVVVEPDGELTSGSTVECQLPNSFNAEGVSPSTPKEWQTVSPEEQNYVEVTGDGTAMFDCRVESREFVGGYDVPTRHGQCVVAEVDSGTVPGSGSVTVSFRNTTSPWIADQRPDESDHEGLVFVRVDGEKVSPAPTFRVWPGPAEYHRLIVPSGAASGEPFRLLLVSFDAYNNVSSSAFSGVVLRSESGVISGDVSYTGRHEERVALSETGVHRLTAEIPGWGDVTSNPVHVSEDPSEPYWGDVHVHNDPSVDAMGNIPYDYARNASGLDFAAATEHGAIGLAPYWRRNRRRARECNDPGTFVTIPAFKTNTAPSFDDGVHVNVYLYDDIDYGPIERMCAGDSLVSAPELDAFLADREAVTQLHHTGWGFDMRRQYHETTDLIEIYSMHGTSELYDPESSIYMDRNRAREGVASEGPYYARDAWALGQRFATHGSSDNHFGHAGVRYNSVTGVYADELTRESVLDSMVEGRCYATTGERIILNFEVDGRPMGSELAHAPGDDLTFDVEAHGTDVIDAVEVFSCPVLEPDTEVAFGEFRFGPDDERVAEVRDSWETAYRASDVGAPDFEDSWTATFDGEPTVYYVRVTQADPIELPCKIEGQDEYQVRDVYAWSTPVWVRPGQ